MNKFKPFFGVMALLLVVLATGLWAWRPLRGGERLSGAGERVNGAEVRDDVTGLVRRQELSWMSLDEATGKLQKEQRPILIDLYTTWCGWCKQMDKKTYSNKQVAQYLQDKFYPVKVDAETHAAINWNGRTYQFNPSYRSNEFALYLTHGRLEFPTTIIIPPGGEPQAIPGYMEPKELELLVKYFGEGKFGKVSFDEYEKGFKPSW
jgi:thioredoxin-related protein